MDAELMVALLTSDAREALSDNLQEKLTKIVDGIDVKALSVDLSDSISKMMIETTESILADGDLLYEAISSSRISGEITEMVLKAIRGLARQ